MISQIRSCLPTMHSTFIATVKANPIYSLAVVILLALGTYMASRPCGRKSGIPQSTIVKTPKTVNDTKWSLTLETQSGIKMNPVEIIKNMVEHPNDEWSLSTDDLGILHMLTENPMVRSGCYLPIEFVFAYHCMREGRPQDFKSLEHLGQSGFHIPERGNALDFFGDCKQAFPVLIGFLTKDKDKEFKSSMLDFFPQDMRTTMTGQEFADGLTAMLESIKAKVPDIERK